MGAKGTVGIAERGAMFLLSTFVFDLLLSETSTNSNIFVHGIRGLCTFLPQIASSSFSLSPPTYCISDRRATLLAFEE